MRNYPRVNEPPDGGMKWDDSCLPDAWFAAFRLRAKRYGATWRRHYRPCGPSLLLLERACGEPVEEREEVERRSTPWKPQSG